PCRTDESGLAEPVPTGEMVESPAAPWAEAEHQQMPAGTHRLTGFTQQAAWRQAEIQAEVQQYHVQGEGSEEPAGFVHRQAVRTDLKVQAPVVAQDRMLLIQQPRQQAILHQVLTEAFLQLLLHYAALAAEQHLAGSAVEPLPSDTDEPEQIFLTDGTGLFGNLHGASGLAWARQPPIR